jgi:hypothetical protein
MNKNADNLHNYARAVKAVLRHGAAACRAGAWPSLGPAD